MKRIKQTGFTVVEALIIAVIVIALAGVGFWVFKQQSDKEKDEDKTTNSQTSQEEDVAAPAAAEVNTVDDLEKAEKSLDDVKLDDTSDNTELDAQSNAF